MGAVFGRSAAPGADPGGATKTNAAMGFVGEMPLASKYGSTLGGGMKPKETPNKVRMTSAANQAFLMAVALPFSVYAIACSAMVFVYFYKPDQALGLIAAAALIPLWFAMKAAKDVRASTAAERAKLEEEKNHGNVLGLKCMLALIFGTGFGYFIYTSYIFVYEATMQSQTYTNISPNMPGGGAGLSDAGRVTFSSETWVDASRGVGYVGAGGVYCVAPVLDAAARKDIEFWAIGTCSLPLVSSPALSWMQPSCCCGERGLFHCGDVALSPGTQKTAVVNLFVDPEFHDAVKLSMAVNGVTSSEQALFLRFESDVDSYLYWLKATGYILYGGGLLVSFVVGYIVASKMSHLL
jgi:hypothetical protein